MTLHELIEALDDLAATNGGDAVMIATQPGWPLAVHLCGVYAGEDGRVWLVEGDQADNPYSVPSDAWAAVR